MLTVRTLDLANESLNLETVDLTGNVITESPINLLGDLTYITKGDKGDKGDTYTITTSDYLAIAQLVPAIKLDENGSLAVGADSEVDGNNCVALGAGCSVWADDATAIGSYSYSVADFATTIGCGSYTEGEAATAIGTGAIALYNDLFVIGNYNVAEDKIFIVGDGTDSRSRHNIITVDSDHNVDINGSTAISGTLSIGATSVNEQQLQALLNLKGEMYFAKGDSNTAGVWHTTIPEVTEYFEGLTIYFYVNVAGASTTTLEVNNLGACNCYRNISTAISTSYGVGCIVPLTYVLNNGVGVWRVADYSVSTPTATNAVYWFKGATIDSTSATISSATVFGFLGNGNVCGLLLSTTTGTAKKASTNGFNLSRGIYYSNTTPSNGVVHPNGAYQSFLFDCRYLVDKSSFTLYSKTFYKFTKGNDGLYYFYHPEATTDNTWDGDGWFVSDTTMPTDATVLNNIESNGIYFYYLGMQYGGTSNRSIGFSQQHELYHVSNGQWVMEYV